MLSLPFTVFTGSLVSAFHTTVPDLASIARIQPYVFAGGITLMAVAMSFAGSYGVPRRHWDVQFTGAPIAGIRDKQALAKLPTNEQKAFAQLWADVAALLKKGDAPARKEGKP